MLTDPNMTHSFYDLCHVLPVIYLSDTISTILFVHYTNVTTKRDTTIKLLITKNYCVRVCGSVYELNLL